MAELREEKWDRVLAALLSAAGKRRGDAPRTLKNANWKVRIARELRSRSTATNAWIAQGLAMGYPTEYAI